jgi:hypothetical protein
LIHTFMLQSVPTNWITCVRVLLRNVCTLRIIYELISQELVSVNYSFDNCILKQYKALISKWPSIIPHLNVSHLSTLKICHSNVLTTNLVNDKLSTKSGMTPMQSLFPFFENCNKPLLNREIFQFTPCYNETVLNKCAVVIG